MESKGTRGAALAVAALIVLIAAAVGAGVSLRGADAGSTPDSAASPRSTLTPFPTITAAAATGAPAPAVTAAVRCPPPVKIPKPPPPFRGTAKQLEAAQERGDDMTVWWTQEALTELIERVECGWMDEGDVRPPDLTNYVGSDIDGDHKTANVHWRGAVPASVRARVASPPYGLRVVFDTKAPYSSDQLDTAQGSVPMTVKLHGGPSGHARDHGGHGRRACRRTRCRRRLQLRRRQRTVCNGCAPGVRRGVPGALDRRRTGVRGTAGNVHDPVSAATSVLRVAG